jgi:hypothetical protein
MMVLMHEVLQVCTHLALYLTWCIYPRNLHQWNKHSRVLMSLQYGARSQFWSFSSNHGKTWPSIQSFPRLSMQYTRVSRTSTSGITKWMTQMLSLFVSVCSYFLLDLLDPHNCH